MFRFEGRTRGEIGPTTIRPGVCEFVVVKIFAVIGPTGGSLFQRSGAAVAMDHFANSSDEVTKGQSRVI